jgi:hypothetical protein
VNALRTSDESSSPRAAEVARLAVDRAELLDAFRQLTRFARRAGTEEAVLSWRQGCLRVDFGGVTVKASASGEWPGRARIAWRVLRPAATHVPAGDPVCMRVVGSQLHIAGYRADCVWQPESSPAGQLPLILIPLDPSLRQILALRYRFAAEDLAASGHLRTLEKAEAKLAIRIDKAWAQLAPVGVSRKALRAAVEAALRQAARRSDDEAPADPP